MIFIQAQKVKLSAATVVSLLNEATNCFIVLLLFMSALEDQSITISYKS